MPILSDREYVKLANAAAKDLVDHEIDLNDSLDKLASQYNMNDEQLARLCEATNNAAFNAVFESKGKQGSEDRLVDFKVASAKEILSRRVAAEKTAAARAPHTPAFDPAWESRPLRAASAVDYQEKTAMEHAPTESQLRRYAVQNEQAHAKALDNLRIEKIAQEQIAQDAFETAVSIFRPMYAREKFARFEKEAMCLHGTAATPLLDGMRARLSMPEVTRQYHKVAQMIVLDPKTPAHTAFKKALNASKKAADYQTTLERHGRG